MFSDINLIKTIDKESYKSSLKNLELKLKELQLVVAEMKIPVIIIFDGWSAAGKGTQMKRLVYPLDPHLFNVYPMAKVTEDMQMRPFLWDYFNKTPLKGRITIFDKGWSRNLVAARQNLWKFNDKEKKNYYKDINAFEKLLTDDGAVIIKLFLHISKQEQQKRIKELIKSPITAWKVNQNDLNNYEESKEEYEIMIEQTSTESAPWNIIESNDKKFATIKIFNIIIDRLQNEINKLMNKKPEKQIEFISTKNNILQSVNPNLILSNQEYKQKLDHYQGMLYDISNRLYHERQGVVIVYEGWDAAGKGGNIKRITEELDPRGYEVVPISAPTKEELDHHYLWRFYKKLPKDGHIAIFDRSWYGRVLVERIEGFSDVNTWSRAYKEINDMEKHWANHGIIFFKFWLHIDDDEQLKRFEARQNDPVKKHKITDEDWRNREKWDLYTQAANDMLELTSTSYAPWTIIESNDKKHARIKTLKIVTEGINKRLK